MRSRFAAAALVAALLTGASAAPAADIGANDDTGKYLGDFGRTLYADMAGLGLRQIVLTSRFKPSDPLTIQDKAHLDRTIPAAVAAGLRVVLAVYPYPPREIEAGRGSPVSFGAYVAALAAAFPDVEQFVIGNEPNQPAFWRPQFGADGANASAAAFGPYLAAAYDALKAVDPAITVVGVGLSPRGNDRPNAKNNVSTSPVRFLRALGAWYRSSGRSRPLMDGFSFHPYPNKATDPLDRGYGWPNAGFVNVDRIKQALWDAFQGTTQPTTATGLRLYLDEVGWQVSTDGLPGYSGLENVVVTDEVTQAAVYAELVRRASCDPDIAEVSFFGFRDDGARAGFQAALQRLDGTPRPAVEAVRDAIAGAAAGCGAPAVAWKSADAVLDPSIEVREAGSSASVRVRAGEDARAVVCVTPMALGEGLVRHSARTQSASCRSTALVGQRPVDIELPAFASARTGYELAVELAAEANTARRTLIIRPSGFRSFH
jgi:hypothetical protein